jgi:hypothetical protein
VAGGSAAAILGLLSAVLGVELPVSDTWWLLVGIAVAIAGVVAVYSMQIVVFDIRERTYRLRQGSGALLSTVRGSLSELDAIVLIAEPNSNLVRGGVTYHLVLHWKGQRRQPMVLQQETRVVGAGLPLNAANATLLQAGSKYAAALSLPFYDNSHFPSANPVPILH